MENRKHSIIDAHAMIGVEFPLAQPLADLLRKMDEQAVELAVVRPMGAELVVNNRAGNDCLLAGGHRIRALVSANPWFGEAAIDELKRCRDIGAAGLFLHPARQGFLPLEPIASPLLEFAAEVNWPVMFHTGTFAYSDVLAVTEAARRYPETPFILGCGGFADMWFEVPGAMESAPNLWLETSHILGTGIRTVLKSVGAERVMFGSGEPSNRYACAIQTVKNLDLGVSADQLVFYENARRLFNLH